MSKILGVEMKRPLTLQEAAKQLEYHPDHLRRLLRTGKANGERIGQMWLIDPAEVERIKALQGPGGRLPKEPKQKSG
jgi:excisionase family DNA binding protein